MERGEDQHGAVLPGAAVVDRNPADLPENAKGADK